MADWPYNGPWQRVRLTVLERDNHTCQIRLPGCTHQATAVDHIIPFSKGGAPYDPNNFHAVCRFCP